MLHILNKPNKLPESCHIPVHVWEKKKKKGGKKKQTNKQIL